MSKRIYLGLDMGGTDIKGTAADDAGEILIQGGWNKILSRVNEGPEISLGQLKIAAEQALEMVGATWDDVLCVGLDTPGPASLDGQLSQSPNLNHPGWNDFNVRAGLEKLIGRPVIYNNDGNAAAYWEYFRLYGDGQEKILAAAILGTGLGGALIHRGEVITGARGFGAEFGHVRIPSHKLLAPTEPVPVCGCGKEACAEAFVSLTALGNFMRRGLERPELADHPLHDLSDADNQRAKSLLGLAQQGDAFAQELFDFQARALGLLFVQLANCFDPHIFIIGGGITEGSGPEQKRFVERFVDLVQKTFREEAFELSGRETLIEIAGAQDSAGCRGSALLARQHARQQGW